MASVYANLLGQKKAFTEEKSSTPKGLVWDTNVAAVSLFWDTNMAAVTSCESILYNSTKALGLVSLLTVFCTIQATFKKPITPKACKAEVNLLALAFNRLQDDHEQGS